ELDAGGGGAHHQHAALRKLVGVAVGAGRQLGDRGGQPDGGTRHVRAVAPARGDDDLGGVPVALVGRDGEPVAVTAQGEHGRALVHRRVEGTGVGLEVAHDLTGGHVPVGVVALVLPPGQAGGPVGGQQSQG